MSTKIQLSIPDDMAASLKAKSKSLGFSSQNEAVRVALKAFIDGRLNFNSIPDNLPVEYASPELEKRLIDAENSSFKMLDPNKSLSEQLLSE
jgi:metal-responsive CopG/Arc/MetJ family transcriptional regulator